MVTEQQLPTGLYQNMPEAEYRALPGENQSRLKLALKSWAHYRDNYQPEGSDDMARGVALHALLLQPSRVDEIVLVPPEINRRTNAGKDEWAALMAHAEEKNLTVVCPEEMEEARIMAEAVRAHPEAGKVVRASGQTEAVALWEWYGRRCKARIDKIIPGRVLVDLKTTRDASPAGFRNAVTRMRYDIQAAWYEHGFRECTGSHQDMVFIAIENTAPYTVASLSKRITVNTLDQETVEIGRKEIRRLVRELQDCEKRGEWPGYPRGVNVSGHTGWFRAPHLVTIDEEEESL